MVGVIRGRTVAFAERSYAAIPGVRPSLESGGRAGSVSALPMEAAVEVRRHGVAELQPRMSNGHMRARAHSGDWRVGPALSVARCRVSPLEYCLLPAVAMEPVESFL